MYQPGDDYTYEGTRGFSLTMHVPGHSYPATHIRAPSLPDCIDAEGEPATSGIWTGWR